MMKINNNIPALTLILLSLSATSCHRVVIDSQEKENFLSFAEIGFYPEGTQRFIYDEDSHQQCVNPSRGQFRIQTNSQDTCMNVILERHPREEGEMVMSQLDYYDGNLKISDRCELECSRNKDGKLWLWDSYAKTGLIISDY